VNFHFKYPKKADGPPSEDKYTKTYAIAHIFTVVFSFLAKLQ